MKKLKYIKYADLKDFLLSFEDYTDDMELIKLKNFIYNYFEVDILLDPNSFDIFIPRSIVDEYIGYEEELYDINVEDFKKYLLPIKFRHLNVEHNHKIYNLFENSKRYKILCQEVKKLKKYINKNTKLLNDMSILTKCYKDKKILCFDFEAFENNQNIITELGISTLINGIYKSEHYIVKENLAYKNKRNIKDKKFNFNFGHSKTLELKKIIKILKNYLDESDLIIGQSIDNDFEYVNKFLKNQDEFPKNFISMKNYNIMDTHDMTFLFIKSGMGMKKALDMFEIPYRNLHNGGNDSRYNILMFEYMLKNFDKEKNEKNLMEKRSTLEELSLELEEKYEIKQTYEVNENMYKLDKTGKILELYFDTKNSILLKNDLIIFNKNNVQIQNILENGFFTSLLRKIFTSNTFYLQKVFSDTCTGVLAFSNQNDKKMRILDIDGTYFLNNDVFISCEETLDLQIQKGKTYNKFFIEKLIGKGKAVICANNDIEKIVLKDKSILLDDFELLAWQDTLILEEKSKKVSGTGILYVSKNK